MADVKISLDNLKSYNEAILDYIKKQKSSEVEDFTVCGPLFVTWTDRNVTSEYGATALIGTDLQATRQNQLIVGQYNDISRSDEVFVVAGGNTNDYLKYAGRYAFWARGIADPATTEQWYETGHSGSLVINKEDGVYWYSAIPSTVINGFVQQHSYYPLMEIEKDPTDGSWVGGASFYDYFTLSETDTQLIITCNNPDGFINDCLSSLPKTSSSESSIVFAFRAYSYTARKNLFSVTSKGDIIGKIHNTKTRDFDNLYGDIVLPVAGSTKVGNTVFGRGLVEATWTDAAKVTGSYNFATGNLREGEIGSDFNLFHGDLLGCRINGADYYGDLAYNAVIAARGNIKIADQNTNPDRGAWGTGRFNLVTGFNHEVYSSYSFITGSTNKDYGTYQNLIAGENNTILMPLDENGYAISQSRQNAVFGDHNTISGSYKMVGGRFVKDDADLLFAIGNGVANAPSNAITVYKDGRVSVGKDPKEAMDVATKQYVDNKKEAIGKLVYSDSSYATSFVNKELYAADSDGDYFVSNKEYVIGTFVQIDTVTDWSDESAYLYIIDFRYNAQNYTQSLIYTPFNKDASNTVLTAGGDGLFLQRLGQPSSSGSDLAGAHNVFLCCPSATTITLGKVVKIKLA